MDAQTARAETKRARELMMKNSLLKACEEGHSSDYSEVLNCLIDLANFINNLEKTLFSSIRKQAQIGMSEFKYTGYITDNQITYLRLNGYSVEVIECNNNLSTIKISWY